jgi:hypothetical protein
MIARGEKGAGASSALECLERWRWLGLRGGDEATPVTLRAAASGTQGATVARM